ncbi:Jerky -like protein-like [Trichinella zimbabwensis]|uniref:Jerky-like protein-like n=1 Tax=Trichinella zimbabwensis TaxID=268475 RepID=A0A0V1H923_9BILA|nr:Jerky -like protein-like [Trichinella zimbabwensis]
MANLIYGKPIILSSVLIIFRHGIRELKIHDEKLSADSENAAKYTGTLNDLITKKGYNVDLEYNADETSLVWKYLPETSLVSMTEKTD